jgi:hypothetical protein
MTASRRLTRLCELIPPKDGRSCENLSLLRRLHPRLVQRRIRARWFSAPAFTRLSLLRPSLHITKYAHRGCQRNWALEALTIRVAAPLALARETGRERCRCENAGDGGAARACAAHLRPGGRVTLDEYDTLPIQTHLSKAIANRSPGAGRNEFRLHAGKKKLERTLACLGSGWRNSAIVCVRHAIAGFRR